MNQGWAWTDVSEGKKKWRTRCRVFVCAGKWQEAAARSSCRGNGLTVIRWEKKSDEKTTLDTFVVSQQTDLESVNQALQIGVKKSLPPQRNQSAREIQNWPTDYFCRNCASRVSRAFECPPLAFARNKDEKTPLPRFSLGGEAVRIARLTELSCHGLMSATLARAVTISLAQKAQKSLNFVKKKERERTVFRKKFVLSANRQGCCELACSSRRRKHQRRGRSSLHFAAYPLFVASPPAFSPISI